MNGLKLGTAAVFCLAAAAVVSLRRGVRSKSYKGGPLTIDNLAQMVPKPKSAGISIPDFAGMYASALEKIQKSRRELFASGAPRLDSFKQGKLGDCFCLAPLGAMIHRDPLQVVKMFTPNADGTVAVQLGLRKVTVPMPTDGELAIMASTGHDGLWANAYEKAVGEARGVKSESGEKPLGFNVITKGGSAGVMVETITGHQITRFSCSPWRDAKADQARREELLADLRSQLVAAQKERRLICGGTGTNARPPGIVGNHAYAILAYDPARDMVTLWNPQGANFKPKGPDGLEHGYTSVNGRLDVPLSQLVAFFGGFSFETTLPSKN